MAKDPNKKGIVAEFKAFISRGSVMDLAVGTIIGAAFTSIVSALTNGILKPFINWIIYLIAGGDGGLEALYTVLVGVYVKDESGKVVLDTANSIFIDWGAFISAIINFLLIAIVLFAIIKVFNTVKDEAEKAKAAFKKEEKTEE